MVVAFMELMMVDVEEEMVLVATVVEVLSLAKETK